MLPTLDARLTAAAELVLPGRPVADIGCDHGKLTAVLAASGNYPKVIGADLRPGPLAKAKQTLEHAGCEDRAELRLGDGLSVLSAGEVGTVVLAGVSAQTTWEIIEQAPWVMQPGGPLVCGDGRRVHRRAEGSLLHRMPVRQDRRVAGGRGLCGLAESQAPPVPAGCAGWDRTGRRDRHIVRILTLSGCFASSSLEGRALGIKRCAVWTAKPSHFGGERHRAAMTERGKRVKL